MPYTPRPSTPEQEWENSRIRREIMDRIITGGTGKRAAIAEMAALTRAAAGIDWRLQPHQRRFVEMRDIRRFA